MHTYMHTYMHTAEDLDVLNIHLAENEVETTLRQRLREFLHQSASLRRHRAIVPVLEQMSPQLKVELRGPP